MLPRLIAPEMRPRHYTAPPSRRACGSCPDGDRMTRGVEFDATMSVTRGDGGVPSRREPRRSLPADARLLLACAARGPDPGAIEPVLDDGAWAGLVERAVRHRLGPLVYMTLRAASEAGVVRPPEALTARLRGIYERHARRAAQRIAKLAEIGRAFERAGIPVIVLKGAALGPALYGDPALRTMGDVDLLVRREQQDAAGRVLLARGYVADLAWGSEAWYQARHHHLAPLRAADGSLIVELHHTIAERGEVAFLWRTCGTVRAARDRRRPFQRSGRRAICSSISAFTSPVTTCSSTGCCATSGTSRSSFSARARRSNGTRW